MAKKIPADDDLVHEERQAYLKLQKAAMDLNQTNKQLMAELNKIRETVGATMDRTTLQCVQDSMARRAVEIDRETLRDALLVAERYLDCIGDDEDHEVVTCASCVITLAIKKDRLEATRRRLAKASAREEEYP